MNMLRWFGQNRARWSAVALLACALVAEMRGTTANATAAVAVVSDDVCQPAFVTPVLGAAGSGDGAHFWRFFDNYGSYMPRLHCLQNADGTTDWPWAITLVVLSLAVCAGYLRIFLFWRRNYLAEAPRDRNRKLMDLAYIFLFCAICGYAMSVVMFWWPAYRLLAVFLAVLAIFTFRFAHNLKDLTVSLSAVRIQRELKESLASRTAELEKLVAQRTQELEAARASAIAADEAKSHFLANMSHEIRTPMTAILGFSELLDNPNLSPEMRQRHLRTVRESGKHLLNVVNDILDLARIESGRLMIERVPCDFHELLTEVKNLITPRAVEKGLTVQLQIDPRLPHRIDTDPTRVRQILLNLIGNAVKFTERGHVQILARRDDADVNQPLAIIEIIDSGIGMSDEQMSRLFQRFNQAETSTARRFGGSGLGLVIARHLVTMLGGELTVASKLGEGSRFTITLPLKCELIDDELLQDDEEPEASEPSAESSITNVKFDGSTVLVVDDGAENRRLVQYMLERHGVKVELAEDGQVAVDRVLGEPGRFAAILMDIHMPRLDGYAASALLRQRGYAGPIIALTASTMIGDKEKCLAAGCDYHVGKPIDADVLVRTLRQSLATAKW